MITRTIAAGQSQFIEPNIEPSLVDGGAYAVTVRADQPLAVVVNTHNDDPSVAHPVAYSTDGIAGGAGTLYGAYAAKNAMELPSGAQKGRRAPSVPATSSAMEDSSPRTKSLPPLVNTISFGPQPSIFAAEIRACSSLCLAICPK